MLFFGRLSFFNFSAKLKKISATTTPTLLSLKGARYVEISAAAAGAKVVLPKGVEGGMLSDEVIEYVLQVPASSPQKVTICTYTSPLADAPSFFDILPGETYDVIRKTPDATTEDTMWAYAKRGETIPAYSEIVASGSWVDSAYTITAATHGHGQTPLIAFAQEITPGGGVWANVLMSYEISSDGNITIDIPEGTAPTVRVTVK